MFGDLCDSADKEDSGSFAKLTDAVLRVRRFASKLQPFATEHIGAYAIVRGTCGDDKGKPSSAAAEQLWEKCRAAFSQHRANWEELMKVEAETSHKNIILDVRRQMESLGSIAGGATDGSKTWWEQCPKKTEVLTWFGWVGADHGHIGW